MNPIEVLEDFLNDPNDFDMKEGDLDFSIHNGYIKIDVRHRKEWGSSHTVYSYHPRGVCEGKGICAHCGQTLWNEI